MASLLFLVDHYRFESDENKFTVSKLDIVLGGGETKRVSLSTQYLGALKNLASMSSPSSKNALK